MSEKTYCEKCGSEMKVINENHPDGMTCQNCGWGWVTSYFEPILSDTLITILSCYPARIHCFQQNHHNV